MPGTAKIFVKRGKKNSFLWKARVFTSHAELAAGIMKSPPDFQPALFIFPNSSRWRNSIHSFFCPKFDAVFLDEEFEVVDVISQIQPFQLLVIPRQRAKYLLELPAGEAKSKSVALGQKFQFKFLEG